MKKLFLFSLTAISLLSFLVPHSTSSAQDHTADTKAEQAPTFIDFTPSGSWQPDVLKIHQTSEKEQVSLSDKLASRTYFVYISKIPEDATKISYGGALNLKYFSGIAYDYLQENLPGKTVSFSVNIPKSAVSSFNAIPNRLRVSLKSVKDNVWTEYYEGSEWTNIRKEGKYDFNIKIPENPVPAPYGTATFYPNNTILIAVEYYLMEGAKRASSVSFSISDFSIKGIDLDPRNVEWQLLVNGRSQNDNFLPSFPKNSTLIYSMGYGLEMKYANPAADADTEHAFSGPLVDIFLTLPIRIPEDLRRQKGTVELTIKDSSGTIRSTVKNFDSCNIEGRVFLTIPLDAFSVKKSIEELLQNSTIMLRIKTTTPHTKDMMPIAVEPLGIREGELIPFDKKWQIRDAQGLGGYKKIDIRQDRVVGDGGLTVDGFGPESYQITATTRLQGGIDWECPYYKVELIRDLDNAPVDMDNMHLEVIVSPITSTIDFWQKPYRARLGLMDINGNLIFGPNVSLSEGLSSIETLDVSITNPIPKGLQTPGFDPKKVKSVILNIEASHAKVEIKDITLSFTNLSMRPGGEERPNGIKKIDFNRFTRNPKSWELTRLVKESGGYLIGINYPFPVIKVDRDILEIPQVYPTVGMKVTDPRHLGLASDLTKKTVTADFETLAANDLILVRLFTLGHLDGVFTWDEKGLDIKDFGKGNEVQVQDMAGMSVEKLAEFLNANEETFFAKSDSGDLLGLEKHVMGDMKAILDILEDVEKNTGKRVYVIISLYDFLLADGSTKEGPLRAYTVGEHPEVVLNPMIKVKAQALVWKLMKDLAKDKRFQKYVACVEIMNEPANATVLSTKKNFNDLLNFVGEGMYLTKDAIGPKVPVSVGFRSWPADLRFWAPIANGLDVLMIHYWESLESYNINVKGLWPLDMSVAKLWEYLGTTPEGRLTGMGEIGPKEPLKKNLFDIEKACYDFCLIWSYSGHDSYNAKLEMAKINEYQKGNRLFAQLRKIRKETLKKAFRCIISARVLFEEQKPAKDGGETRERDFKAYLTEELNAITDPAVKKATDDILKIAELKGLPLNSKDMRVILFEALEGKTPRVADKVITKP